MSAILIALRRDRIQVLADTKATGYASVAKVWPILHTPAVICGRGPAGLLIDTAVHVGAMASDFDQFAQNMTVAIDAVLRANSANISRLTEQDRQIEVYAAGISPTTSQPTVFSYLLTNAEATGVGYERSEESGDFLIVAPWIAFSPALFTTNWNKLSPPKIRCLEQTRLDLTEKPLSL